MSSVSKIYDKNDKINVFIRNTNLIKTIVIYKYNKENTNIHSISVENGGFKMKSWQSYYELQIREGDVIKKTISVSKDFIEQLEYISNLETNKKTININTGNIYETKTKYFNREKYLIEFKNNELYNFDFKLHKNKINEYLKK